MGRPSRGGDVEIAGRALGWSTPVIIIELAYFGKDVVGGIFSLGGVVSTRFYQTDEVRVALDGPNSAWAMVRETNGLNKHKGRHTQRTDTRREEGL